MTDFNPEISINDVVATNQEATVVVDGERFVFTTSTQLETMPSSTQVTDLANFKPDIIQQYRRNNEVIEMNQSAHRVRKITNRIMEGTVVLASFVFIGSMETSGDRNIFVEGFIGATALGFAMLGEKSTRLSSEKTQSEVERLQERRVTLNSLLNTAQPHFGHANIRIPKFKR